MLINSTVGILSQGISNHHIVHFKYVTILFVNYTPKKLRRERERQIQDLSSSCAGTKERPCEDITRRWTSMYQEAGSHQELNRPAP